MVIISAKVGSVGVVVASGLEVFITAEDFIHLQNGNII